QAEDPQLGGPLQPTAPEVFDDGTPVVGDESSPFFVGPPSVRIVCCKIKGMNLSGMGMGAIERLPDEYTEVHCPSSRSANECCKDEANKGRSLSRWRFCEIAHEGGCCDCDELRRVRRLVTSAYKELLALEEEGLSYSGQWEAIRQLRKYRGVAGSAGRLTPETEAKPMCIYECYKAVEESLRTYIDPVRALVFGLVKIERIRLEDVLVCLEKNYERFCIGR
ncbi:MAG: hypothetical protein ACUVT7_09675, partial [Thermoplasmata archaeon]